MEHTDKDIVPKDGKCEICGKEIDKIVVGSMKPSYYHSKKSSKFSISFINTIRAAG